MARTKQTLDKRYGKLTVLREADQTVWCRCDCGAEKAMTRSNLLAGRALSCGKKGCRVYRRNPDNPGRRRGPKPKGPSWILPEKIAAVWEQRAKGVDIAYIADQLGVSRNTLYTLFKGIRAAGGIIPYLEAINTVRVEHDQRPVEVPPVDPLIVAKPAPDPQLADMAARSTAVSLGIPKPPSIYIPPKGSES